MAGTPDAIWFDNLRSYGTPNYYVQKVSATNMGTRIIPVTPQAQDGLYTSASVDERTHELIVKAINVTPMTRAVNFDLTGASPSAAAKLITLANADLKAENSFDRPRNVSPEYSTVEVKSGLTPVSLRPYSVTVYRIRVQ